MAIGTRASPFSETPRPLRLPDSRAAPSIFHCLEGSSVVAITSRDRPCSCYFSIPRCGFSRLRAFVSSETLGRRRFLKSSFSTISSRVFFARARSRAPSFPLRSPLVAAQETKRQGKRAGHDWIQALELRQGLPRRQRLGRFGTSRRVAAFSSVPTKRFRRKKKREAFVKAFTRAFSRRVEFRRRVSPPTAVKINRHL